jgi:MFS family permease
MKTATGVFKSFSEADRAFCDLQAAGIPPSRINVLVPGLPSEVAESVPTTAAEQRGLGKGIGAVVGFVSGIALGPLAITAAAYVINLLELNTAGWFVASVLFGIAGGVAGAIVGGYLEDYLSEGMPKDELSVYKDALRQGRTILVVLAEEDEARQEARQILSRDGAESIDPARRKWWIGLRRQDKERYAA